MVSIGFAASFNVHFMLAWKPNVFVGEQTTYNIYSQGMPCWGYNIGFLGNCQVAKLGLEGIALLGHSELKESVKKQMQLAGWSDKCDQKDRRLMELSAVSTSLADTGQCLGFTKKNLMWEVGNIGEGGRFKGENGVVLGRRRRRRRRKFMQRTGAELSWSREQMMFFQEGCTFKIISRYGASCLSLLK